MKHYILSDEEQKILEDYEKGKLISINNFDEEKKRYQEIAAATLNKTKNINIRLSEKDVQKAKAKAAQTGIPYQTLLSSIIHQFVNN